MAAHSRIITSAFPEIDCDLLEYVTGVLDTEGDDFEDIDDVYEAVGGMLHEVAADEDEEEIRSICEQLLGTLKGATSTGGQSSVRKLDAAVHLGQKMQDEEDTAVINDDMSIWLALPDNTTSVDKTKLAKAEAKLKMKQESKSKKAVAPRQNGLLTATASQATNRKELKMEESDRGNRSTDIRIENFDVAFGDKVLLKEANLLLSYGRRYGFVGRNGVGKSTLLRMISLRELRIQSHITVLHVEQEVIGDDTIALDSVLECDEMRESLLKEEKQLNEKLHATSPGSIDPSISTRLTQVYQKLEEIEADKAPAKAGMILAGLGFTPGMQAKSTRTFSGGWRMRIALARALFTKPDLLLLDEPTNMLDIKAILWLESYLQTWPTTILVVSHDKNFLDYVTTDIIHLHSKQLNFYKGNYTQFYKTKEEKLKNQQREYDAQMDVRAHAQVFIDRFRFNAKRASLVQSKLKFLEKLPELQPVEKEPDVVLKFPSEVTKLSPPIIQLDEVTFHYDPNFPIFKKIDISASMESRICIVGENGSGKTTLLKILLGQLEPVNGLRHYHRNLRIGYFSQHHIDQLEMDQTSIEVMASRYPGKNSEEYRRMLGSYGVSGELATRPVTSLSGGQKSRVAFALMCAANPNYFILDEPTNHLDIATVEALGNALNKFKGGVILVSHDESLIRMICKELWVCSNNTVKSMEGGLDEYKKMVEAEFAQQNQGKNN